jgi:hypothetical protein
MTFFTGAEIHRGPTHSIISIFIIFIPIFILLRKKAVPYFLAMVSHPLIADFIAGGQLQLLWPITNQEFGLHDLGGPLHRHNRPREPRLGTVLICCSYSCSICVG